MAPVASHQHHSRRILAENACCGCQDRRLAHRFNRKVLFEAERDDVDIFVHHCIFPDGKTSRIDPGRIVPVVGQTGNLGAGCIEEGEGPCRFGSVDRCDGERIIEITIHNLWDINRTTGAQDEDEAPSLLTHPDGFV